MPASIAIGLTLAFWLTGKGSWGHPYVLQSVLIALFFGILASITFVLFERIELLDMEVKQRQLNQIESDKRQMEAQLKMLQAQIEPHFLFNTLANVSSLIDVDPMLAKQLLERLNDWLRIALVRARSDSATLGDELDMLENYLQIMKIRFGERLRWNMNVPEDTRLSSFPPMLLQPLVENAVRHGIEPKLGGGEINIRARIENSALSIEVSDSGVGMVGTANGEGTGLANVRARLATLFGATGNLTLRSNEQGGATAILELPR
jgi:sensor histidine kinase YesM